MSDRIFSTVEMSDVDDEGYGVSTSLSLSARDKKDLLRLLRLCGVIDDSQSIEDWFDEHPGNPEIADFSDIESIKNIDDIEEQAEYDYGKDRTNRKGKKFPLNPYEYEGTAQEPTRYVPARSGDNPLRENRRKRFSRRR